MLQALRISNFAVIQEAEVTFGTGLTVLTGETGAGKSIVVDALGLLLGGRADPEVIRTGSDEAAVEGLFARGSGLGARLGELGLPDLGDEVSVRRVICRTGRGKAYVNGALVTVGVLAKVLHGLVDIAGQHEHMGIFDPAVHRALLDRVGALDALLNQYRRDYAALKEVDARIAALGGDEQQVASRLEFLQYQLDELSRIDPRPGEDLALEEERRRLAGAEKLRRAAGAAEMLLSTEDGAAIEQVGKALTLLSDASKIDAGLRELVDGLATSKAELEERILTLQRYLHGLDGDPQRLIEVTERLDELRRLCRKHGTDLAGMIAKRGELGAERERLAGRQGALSLLALERGAAETMAFGSARALSAARFETAHALAKAVVQALGQLAMPKARFEVHVTQAPALRPDGLDEVEFFFSANAGEPVRSLAKVASGGEASRLMLALKRTLARSDECGCYVLDEADAGVSGGVAEVVGQMIKEVSAHRQVLCITHLPQVAAYADAHLLIEKEMRAGRTWSRVQPLEDDRARMQELARMLSGVEVTREAHGAAEALVRSARRSFQRIASRAKLRISPRPNLALERGLP